jgi:sugar phosphate isomerase/epimerase
LRDIYPGLGYAPISEYVKALKATGYDDWIAGECFSEKHAQLEGYDVAYTMKKYMEYALY